jgi:hypothetical protein
MLHALMSFDVLETLIDQRGWSTDEFAAHLARVAQSTFTPRERQGDGRHGGAKIM